jgi:hypothetical protein
MNLKILGVLLCTTAVLAAEPLATFESQEIMGRDWARTLVTYPLELRAGQARPGAVRVTDGQGQEVPCQLSRLTTHADGSIASARISFYAALPKGGHYCYTLETGKPMSAGNAPKATVEGGYMTLDNGQVALRLHAGERNYAGRPLRMVMDRTAAVQNLAGLEKSGLAFGPIAGMGLNDGSWVGGSYFTAESIESVRHRQKYRPDAPGAEMDQKAVADAPKVVAYRGLITEQGPLFVEAVCRFEFDNGGHYQMTAQVRRDDPAARVDEVMDLKGNCPPLDPLYLSVVLQDGKQAWKPDAVVLGPNGKMKYAPLEEAIQSQGFTPRFGSRQIACDTDHNALADVVPHYAWEDRNIHYLGVVNSAQLKASKTAPFLGIMPLHAGAWRAAHWVFPPKQPHLFQHLLAWKDGTLEMRWTVRAQPHSQDVLHTGEFDPEFGLTGLRRIWALIGGPFQYHDTLWPMRAYEGYVNLDQYKDWTLAWSPETQEGLKQPVTNTDAPPVSSFNAALLGDDRDKPWYAHYRQAENMKWAVAMRRTLADTSIPAARRGQLKAQMAAFSYLMADPDFNARGSLSHLGNPNMPINRFFALTFAVMVIPDHPMAKTWMDVSADYVRYKGGMNIAPGGAWSELISYYGASAPTLVHGALAAEWLGRLDPKVGTLVAGPVDFTLKIITPPDPRFGVRLVPGFGHEGNLLFNQWTPAAALIQKSNPDLAAAFVWAWDQQGRPGEQQHDNGFTELTGSQVTGLLPQATPEVLGKALSSAWLPGFGAVLRSGGADPKATYLGYRQGYLASHSDANQGDYIIYAKGVPLTMMSVFGYAMRQQPEFVKLYNEFGWHSNVRFGKQTDDGGWPGGGDSSGVHRHYFSHSVDYLKGIGEYSAQHLKPGDATARDLSAPDAVRWTRQIVFLKDSDVNGPNYFVFRDSYRSLHGDPSKLQPTWWYQRTLGKMDQVTATGTGFDYTSQWGPKMMVRFLQPDRVAVESRQGRAQGPQYNYLAKAWTKAGSPTVKSGNDTAVVDEITVNAVGPMPAGQDAMVVIYPQEANETAAKSESLADGVARITTSRGTDYVFAHPDGITFKNAEVSFSGIAGAVRVLGHEVRLVVADGAGTVSHRGYTLKAGKPTTQVVSLADIAKGGTAEVPAPKYTIAFALDGQAGKIEPVAPGVRKQTLSNALAYEFNSEKPLKFQRDQVIFVGRRGGIVVDQAARTTRLVMLEGTTIGHGTAKADVASGPYDLTFHHDKVVGVSEGPGRFVNITQPEGIVMMPTVTSQGISHTPGTRGRIAVVPLLDNRYEFVLENLEQPAVFRSWQLW